MSSAEPRHPVAEDFFAAGPDVSGFLRLFDHLPDAFLYVKDLRSRFVAVNQNLLSIYGTDDPRDLIGRTDRDFHPPVLAEAYIAEDAAVLRRGETIANRTWFVPHVRGTPRWYVSTKTPVADEVGQPIGLAGVMYPIERPQELTDRFGDIAPALKAIESHYDDPTILRGLPARCGMSATSFNRSFRRLLRMTPGEYLLGVRVEAARRKLTTTSATLAEIAAACGFSDQSHFTKRFRRRTGITPRRYRDAYR